MPVYYVGQSKISYFCRSFSLPNLLLVLARIWPTKPSRYFDFCANNTMHFHCLSFQFFP